MTDTIPGPPGFPFLGNVLDMDMELPIRGLERLADQCGPIYQLTLKGSRQIVCSSAELLEELTDERRFSKVPPRAISETPGPKGLFGARNEDPDWGQAHRILMPSFAPLAVQDMFNGAHSANVPNPGLMLGRHERYRKPARPIMGTQRA